MPFTENLDVFLADFGVAVTFSGAPANTVGILDYHDIDVLGDQARGAVNARVFGVRLKSTVAALLAVGQAITVGGTNYVVRDPKADQDGAFTVVELRLAT